MKIYNQNKTEILTEVDLSKGFLVNDKIVCQEIPEQQEQSHYEIVAEYENGGRDVKKIIDVKHQPKKTIFEDIQIFIPYTNKQLAEIEMEDLKSWFDVEYMRLEQKYRRLDTLNLLCDDESSPKENLLKLYKLAEEKRKKIQQLEKFLA